MKHALHELVKVVHLLDPASYGAAAEAFTGDDALDCKGFHELLILIPCGAFTATGDVAFQVEETDEDPAAPDTALTASYADVSGAAISEKVQADDQKTYGIRIDLRKRKRFLRVGYDVDDDACIFGMVAILGSPVGAAALPVTQATTFASV